jgi:hypothetical protein
MSEYQYYEFLAVDRPLTVAEQAEVRLDPDLLEAAAEASPALPEVQDDARLLAAYVAKLSVSDKDRLLILVAEDQAARARTELLRGFRGDPDERRSRPRRTVAGLLNAAAARRMRREQAAAAAAPSSRPCGSSSVRQPGKGAWTNWPRTPRPPGLRPNS